VNAEALVVAGSLTASPAIALAVTLVVTLGQVAGKIVLYQGGRGIGTSKAAASSPRALRLAERLQSRRGLLGLTFFASASVGLPPLYLMAVVAGIARLPVGAFVGLCFAGRFLRFQSLALIPLLF
jgi:membrane protein YqaA with SNARE-associated domain